MQPEENNQSQIQPEQTPTQQNPASTEQTQTNKSDSSFSKLLVVIILLLVVGVLAWAAYQKMQGKNVTDYQNNSMIRESDKTIEEEDVEESTTSDDEKTEEEVTDELLMEIDDIQNDGVENSLDTTELDNL